MAYQLRELQANYAGRQIYDIDKIIIPEGKVIGLIGVNGAGKTTLIKELKNREKQIRPKAVVELLPQLKPDEDISGGQQVQEYINKAFRRPSNILLLDEPTANLDLNHLNKLKYQLKYYPGTVIIISHDRDFLDGVVDEIWELQDGELQTFTGNYTEFVDYKTNQRDQQAKDYQTYRNKQKQLQRALNKKKQQASRATKVPKKYQGTNEAKNMKQHYKDQQGKLSKDTAALKSRLQRTTGVDKPKESKPIKFNLPGMDNLKQSTLLTVNNLTVKRDENILIDEVNLKIKAGQKIAVIGENGTGKTTLLDMIYHAYKQNNDAKIIASPKLKLGYFHQQLTQLDTTKSILDTVNELSIQDNSINQTVLANLGFDRADFHKLVQVLSGGERVKLALARLMVSDINVLMLDEPTNYLDIVTVTELEKMLIDYPGTVILVSHDQQLVDHVSDFVYEIQAKQFNQVK